MTQAKLLQKVTQFVFSGGVFLTAALLPGRRTWVGRTGISIPRIDKYSITQE
jgi:hypothetical protein